MFNSLVTVSLRKSLYWQPVVHLFSGHDGLREATARCVEQRISTGVINANTSEPEIAQTLTLYVEAA